MMSQVATFLFLCLIPTIAAGGLWVLSQEHKLLEKIVTSVGACGLSLLGFLLSVGIGIIAIGGTRADGRPKRGPLVTGWATSATLAVVFALIVHRIGCWGWLMTGFFGLGCFIAGLGIGLLLFTLLDLGFGEK
jgi:hypothetical protein